MENGTEGAPKVKNAAAVNLGRLGGLAAAQRMTPEQRRARAMNAYKATKRARAARNEDVVFPIPAQNQNKLAISEPFIENDTDEGVWKA